MVDDQKPKSVYIIIPVHNRKAITMRCLETLSQNGDLCKYHIVIVDDGSTDGTSELITSLYPEVIILNGDGNLWWTGGIKKGMEYSYSQGGDFFIWLNDDTIPLPNTIPAMVQACRDDGQCIVSAQCYATTDLDEPTYGGQKQKGLSIKLLQAQKREVLECDCLSGNLICLPRSIVDNIGFPPADTLPHRWADIVYTRKAAQSGYKLKVLGYAPAVCPLNPLEIGWASSPIPMSQRWRMLSSIQSNLHPPHFWNYTQMFFGKKGIIVFVTVYLRLIIFTIVRYLVPLDYLKYLKKIKEQFTNG